METKRDKWSKADVLVRLVSTLLIPVVIFIIGNKIGEQQAEADREQRNSDRIALLLKSLGSENERERHLAISFSRHLAESGKFPPELLHVIEDIILSGKESRDNSRGAVEVLASAAEHDPDIARNISNTIRKLPPRVFIQIKNESQRPFAREIADILMREGFKVPGIERVKKEFRLLESELRFFRSDEQKEAHHITEIIQRHSKLRVKPVDLSSTRFAKSTGIDLRHYELWISD